MTTSFRTVREKYQTIVWRRQGEGETDIYRKEYHSIILSQNTELKWTNFTRSVRTFFGGHFAERTVTVGVPRHEVKNDPAHRMQEALVEKLRQRAVDAHAQDGQVHRTHLCLIVHQLLLSMRSTKNGALTPLARASTFLGTNLLWN